MNVVGLEGDGYLEVPSDNLMERGDLSVTFRTLQSDALLLLSRGERENVSLELTFLVSHYS